MITAHDRDIEIILANTNDNEKSSERFHFTSWLREKSGGFVTRLAKGLVKLGITANGLTIIGLLLSIAAAILAAQGKFVYAGFVYLLAGPFDALDGAVARESNQATAFGAIFDSTLDRYAEVFLLTGIGYRFSEMGDSLAVVLTFMAALGSIMVSYARARSEGLGFNYKGGLFTRVERIIVLGLGLILNLVSPALLIMALLTHVTVAQRLWHVYRSSQGVDK